MPTLPEIKAAVQALTAEAQAKRAHAESITRQAKRAKKLTEIADAIEGAAAFTLEGVRFDQPGAVSTVVTFLRSQAASELAAVSLVAPVTPTE